MCALWIGLGCLIQLMIHCCYILSLWILWSMLIVANCLAWKVGFKYNKQTIKVVKCIPGHGITNMKERRKGRQEGRRTDGRSGRQALHFHNPLWSFISTGFGCDFQFWQCGQYFRKKLFICKLAVQSASSSKDFHYNFFKSHLKMQQIFPNIFMSDLF